MYTPGISEHRSTGSLFYNNDALGSLRDIISSNGTMTDDERFDAFGMTVYHGGQSPTTTSYGFVGKKGYQTDTSGLMLLGHRYYDAGIGRFLSRDPIHDGNNWYAYCGNNPLGKTDPSGESGIVQSITTDDMAMHDDIMGGMDDLTSGLHSTIRQAPTESPAGQAEAAAAAQDAGEAGNTGLGKPGKIDVPNPLKSTQKAIRSLEKNIEEHQAKLHEYRKNPWAHDNKGILQRNSNNPQVIERIISRRISHLESEIGEWMRQLAKLKY